MKAILEYNLPEDEMDMKYAIAGIDALLLIEDVINEIRSYLKHGCGELKTCLDDNDNQIDCCPHTMHKIREYICEQKANRNLPDLI